MASEVVALCQSFESELNKQVQLLPPVSGSKPDNHDAHLNHHRISQRLAESVSYYAGRLPLYASVPRILACGDRLFRLQQYQLALQACYKHVRALNLHATRENITRMDALARLSAHVQACFGCAACEAALLLTADPQMKHPDTLQWLVQSLSQLRASIALALPDERLYWLVLNGTVHIYTSAKVMIGAGFAEQALPALVFCIKAIEGHVAFAAPKFLTWRTQLYTWAVYGLVDCKAVDQARTLLTDGLKRIDQLLALQKLDPVPPAPHVQAAFSAARAALLGLQLRVEVAAGGPVAPVLAQISASTAAAPGGTSAAADAALAGLAALIEAMHAPQRRTVRTEPPDAALKELFDAAIAAAAPLLSGLKEALEQQAAVVEAAAASGEPSSDGVAATEAVEAAQERLPYTMHKALMCAAYNLEQWKQFEELAELAVSRTRAADALVLGGGNGAGGGGGGNQSAVQLSVAAELLLALRRLLIQPGMEALRQLADCIQDALARGAPLANGQGGASSQRMTLNGGATQPARGTTSGHGGPPGTARVTVGGTATAKPSRDGTAKTQAPGSQQQQHAMLQQHQLAPWQQLRDLIADASLALYSSGRQLVDGVFCADDREAGTVRELLSACHAAWRAVELDDGELRVGVALKLGLLLEEEGLLVAARDVLLEAKAMVQKARVEAMAANRHGDDEHLRWITASRSQPSDETAVLVAGMTPTEQELACLHVDVLALLARVELGLGVAEQQNRATARRTRVLEEQAQRTAQSSIFGARNNTEVARDEARLAAAGTTTPNPQAKERELLQACAKNPYERAVVLIQMTAFQGSDAVRKGQLLQEAGDLLTRAQAAEDGLFEMAQPDLRARRDVPPPPKILQRTPTSVTLVAHPPGPGLKSLPGARKPPSQYVAYCKAFGAGVGLSINKTAMEYPGSGIMVPLGTPVTIQGLRTNDTYLFAVGLYDEDGQLVGGLGASTPEVPLTLPLPLYMCWAHLLAAAVRCSAWAAAKRAAAVLLPHFVVTTPSVPLWRSNPMDAQSLHRAHVAAAARPLLRALVQCIYVYGGVQLSLAAQQQAQAQQRSSGPVPDVTDPTAPAAPVPQAHIPCTLPQLRAPFLEEQVARLRAARLLVLGMEVSALLPDEPLMQEGALRTYHLLAPLLALRAPRTPLLHKALATCHAVLSSLTNLVQDSLHRQEHQRALSARVAAAVTYQLLRLSDEAGEPGAASHFGKLHLELLRAYDPRVTIQGRPPPPKELQAEASGLHDAVLQHPQLAAWAPEMVSERTKDAEDLPAKVLPLLSTATPMDAWGSALAFETAAEHPRWVELVVRTLEASVRKGVTDKVAAVAEQLVWWVRARTKRPPMDFREAEDAPPPAPWKLEEAAATLTAAQLSFEPPPPPSTEGLSPEKAAEAARQHADEVAAAEAAQRRRVAAAMLLQKRLPKLLQRKRKIDGIRANVQRWAPWLSRFNTVVALVVAAEARKWVVQAPQRAAAAAAAAADQPSAEGSSDAVRSPDPTAGAQPAPLLPPQGITPPLQAMIHLARAAQLAARGGAWIELTNAVRHAWNLARAVLSADPSLTAPLPKVTWTRGQLPEPPTPPESMLMSAAAAAGDKKGKKGAAAKDKPKEDAKAKGPPSPKGGRSSARKKGAVEEVPPPPRTYPLVEGSRPNMARAVRALVDAILELVSRLRDGMPVHTWVVPLEGGEGAAGGGKGPGGLGGLYGGRPTTGAPSVADSRFSYGSDLQVDMWFKEGPLDMAWVSRLMGSVAVVLTRGERWHTLLDVGRSWARLSEGVFNERIMPWLMQAAAKVEVDAGPFQAAMDTLIRDKNQALDQLDKVRTLARERLGETPLILGGMGHKVRKKKKRATLPGEAGPGTGGGRNSLSGDGQAFSDRASLVSAAYTYRTASTYATKASQPDFLRIPAEYEKVIELLKRRNEKGSMVLAMHELGDTHAHFGNWGGAATAWHDTLDTLLGPYQALKNWRPRLDALSPAATLQEYGLHGLLLGVVLAGKLARYGHHDHLTLRLEACRLAARLAFCAFASHVGHPQRPLGFATYTPRELWAAGADAWLLWNDPYRCPVGDLAGALETASCFLLDNGCALEALPLLALWEHVARHVARSLHGTVWCRIVRCRALIALGLMSEAWGVAAGLMGAEQLPDPTLDSDYVLKDTSGQVVKLDRPSPFVNALLPGDPANKEPLAHLADTPLPPAVERLYGAWLVAHLALLRAQFLLAAGGVPSQWRQTDWKTGERVAAPAPATPAKGAAKKETAAAVVTEAVGSGLPEAVEPVLLEKANALLRRALAMARGEDTLAQEPSAGSKTSGPAKGTGSRPNSPPKTTQTRSKSPPPGSKGAKDKDKGKEAAEAPDLPGPPAPPPPTAGQRAEVMVRALLLLCELEQLRWHQARGLGHALEAARFLGAEADSVNVPQQGDNDELERHSLSPVLWFLARAAAVRCAAQLAQADHVHELVHGAVQSEVAAVHEGMHAAAMCHVDALVLAREGRTAEALAGLAAVAARYRAMHVYDTRLACVLMDAAALRDRLGLRADAAALAGQALRAAEAWALDGMGLGEALEAPELTNVYLDGTGVYAAALGSMAAHLSRRRCHAAAEQHACHALLLLRSHTRALPSQHAAACLTVGRMARIVAMCGEGSRPPPDLPGSPALAACAPTTSTSSNAVALTAAKLSAARSALSASITLACLDGGHIRTLMRSSLLELASIFIAGMDPRNASVCLRAAHAASTKHDMLLLATHTLTPVAAPQLPDWAVAYVKGQEARFAQSTGGKPDAPMSDVDVARMVVCHFAALVRSMDALPAGCGFRARAEAQITALHAALRIACAKYGIDACFSDPPLPPSPEQLQAVAIPPGTVLAQWHVQDGCWQEARSWTAEGSLPGAAESGHDAVQGAASITEQHVLSLQPTPTYASLLYVIAAPSGDGGSGPHAGEVTFSVTDVRVLQRKVRQARARLEKPKAPTDLLGYPAPDADGLAEVLKAAERLLSAVPRSSEDGSSVAFSGVGSALDSEVMMEGEVRPELDVGFLGKLEALLELEGGVELVDVTLGSWLVQTLPVML